MAKFNGVVEFVQNEDRFSDVREALKLLNKMDFDKLIASVRPLISMIQYVKILTD